MIKFYTDKKGKVRPITDRKHKSDYHSQAKEPSWKKSSIQNLKVHTTERFHRVRIRQPKKDAKIRTLTLSETKGYKLIRQKPKGKPYETQSVLIERRARRTKAFAKKKAMELKGD